MSYLHRVQRGIDYIEAHLGQDIDLGDVARRAGLSRWHFQRIFKALTHETLKTYIRSRRLSIALDKLLTTDARILELALEAGFKSQEAFTRAFKEAFDMTPHECRQVGHKNRFPRKLEFSPEYLRDIHYNIAPLPEIARRPARVMVGLRTRFFGSDSDKNSIAERLPPLWEAFMARVASIPHRVPGVCYGIIEQTGDESEVLEYTAATEVSALADLPEGMTVCSLPEATYAVFAHRGNAQTVDNTVNYIYASWLLTSEYHHSGGPDLEVYGAQYHPDDRRSVIHYGIPIV